MRILWILVFIYVLDHNFWAAKNIVYAAIYTSEK